MSSDDGMAIWDGIATAMLALAPVQERRSRYAEKPALALHGREIAHCEAPGVIDLRITRDGWSRASEQWHDDPAIHREATRRDWIELRISDVADVERLHDLLVITVAANQS